MEAAPDQNQGARRALRQRGSMSNPGTAAASAPTTPTGSESPKSDLSEGRGSRSSRLSNPEFAAKHKAFMAKVTAATKGSMDTYLTSEIISNLTTGKRKLSPKNNEENNSKRRRSTRTNSSGVDVQSDGYCWICHKEGQFICCETCPRVYHHKCLQLDASPAEDWVCPECVLIMTAENMETRSRAMRLLTIDQLCTLLKHALTRMKSVNNIEPFLKPVDPLQFPAYKDYISCPMDIQSMERNIRRKQYGSTEAMLADCKWILHNCIIFNSPSSKLTSIAKSIIKVCKHEMQEIENCPDCYLNAHIKKDVWFTEACRLPHPLVWAKLKGFPYWPGKVMRVNSENNADIRFFGAHDRAWIPLKDVFLFSKKPPSEIKKKRGNIDNCFEEVEKHIKKLKDRLGHFEYANHKTPYDHLKEAEMLKILFPKYNLPFDIGKVGRRNRSYSFTGSEKSRDATPTPSEAGGTEEEEDHEETGSQPAAVTAPSKLASKRKPEKVESSVTDAILEPSDLDPPTQVLEKVEKSELVLNSDPEPPPKDGSSEAAEEEVKAGAEISAAGSDGKAKVEGEESSDQSESVNVANTDVEMKNVETESAQVKGNEESTCQAEEAKETKEVLEAVSEETSVEKEDDTSTTKLKNLEDVTSENKTAEETRLTTSPPCEVSSTTLNPGTAEEKPEKENTFVEGVIADSNDEKVLIEDDEIDDVEPSASDINQSSAGEVISKDKPVTEDSEEIDDVEPAPEEEKSIKQSDLSVNDVSLTVRDKTKVAKEAPTEEDDAKDDLSVTVSKSVKSSVKVAPEVKKPTEESKAVKKRSSTNLSTEDSSSNDSILTISKVVSLKESSKPASQSVSGDARSQASSPSVQAHNNVAHPFFSPRLPGHRAPHPMGPRVPMMPMVGPGQGMMMRGQFRGPSLQPRPPGPLALPQSLPSAAGPVAEQLNKVAVKLAESLKQNFEETLASVDDQGNPEAVIKRLQMECEKLQWRHQQELAEMKHNADLVIMEMRQTMEQEKQKALMDYRKQAEIEKQKAILEMKKKQWCAHCGKEAIFYCCWNTSYCDYPCQQAHWPSHMATCAQNGAEEDVSAATQPEPIPQQHYMAQLPRGPQHMQIPGDMAPMRFGMRPNLPGPMPFSRPYYM